MIPILITNTDPLWGFGCDVLSVAMVIIAVIIVVNAGWNIIKRKF